MLQLETAGFIRETTGVRWFYTGIGVLILTLCLIGFLPSMLDPSGRAVPLPLTPMVTVHAISATGFIVLFIAQSLLAASDQLRAHRLLGIAGLALAMLFVVTGFFTTVEQAHRGFDLSGDLVPPGIEIPPGGHLGALIGFVLFAVPLLAGLWWRHRPETHKRFMVLTMTGGLGMTPILHIVLHYDALKPFSQPLSTIAWIVLLSLQPVYDRIAHGRVHPVSLWGGIAAFVTMSVFFGFVDKTRAWITFEEWILANS